MPSFGELLRRERESRNAAVEEIADSTRIDPGYLEALERNEFEALPGGAFGKLYIRAYAEVLGFDPAPLLDAYDRERGRRASTPRAAEPRAAVRDRSLGSRRERLDRLVSSGDRRPERRDEPAPVAAAPPLDPEIRESLRAARDRLRRIRPTPPGPSSEEDAPADVVAQPVAAAEAAERSGAPAAVAQERAGVEPPSVVVADPGRERAARLRLAVRPPRAALALLAVGLVLVGGWLSIVLFVGVRDRIGADHPTPPRAAQPRVAGAGDLSAASDAAPAEREPPPADRAAAPVDRAPAEPPEEEATPVRTREPVVDAAPTLSVREFGVGSRVVHRRLVGESDTFAVGDVAWFFTRVIGGRSGERIRHVWLHEGRQMQSIALELGGAHWRTQSRKTLGQAGAWAVEARDEEGRLLARSTFTCLPAGG